MIFKYRSKGAANDDWAPGEIEAEDKAAAQVKLDEIYGVQRDNNGKQLEKNKKMVEVEIIEDGE